MRVVRLASEIDFAGWREAARSLRGQGASPDTVIWTVDGEGDLFADPEPLAAPAPGGFTVSREFLELAEAVILHRSAERFSLLYRMLWRMAAEPNLLRIATDPDVARANDFARQVSKAAHKMKAFVRFRAVGVDPEAYAAWFEPAHRVTESVAPFFAKRFANMIWSILTPDSCIHWNGAQLAVTPGADPADAPGEDALEDYWRTYYASIFNPARLKVDAMTKEMPKRYWRNLPEARLIPDLIAAAEGRTNLMVAQAPSQPNRVIRQMAKTARDATYDALASQSLEEVAAGVDACRRCPLYKDATQGVPGEGPAHARLMLVGEQPGDQEDLAGRPFVGPAGQVLDKALAEAGVPRTETYVTNAVKHFKHELRGKRRIHQTPNPSEVTACRWWVDAERRLIRPRVVVSLGATAALSVFGKVTPIGKNRGIALQLPDQAQGVVTYHPSYLLRVPDAEAKAKAYALFVQDLRFAWGLAA
ncbi:MAG: UdgX family uracil-DNA binding protein [Phenylobacterium sp.]|uniref:UdgX family uracil-DNA binding protein n=1 Tax=Phenylobacterium sp. TaxID=1871053 RepID=UPI002727079D|nr:UdgX family uracil-DNA binding protein [Phenylobacterium sp.]MDO8913782.1 UdgX family uracil-DNA binding protein [Phenylobacterium sp.]MDP3100609.1 UdgX family uracil-DNA binding protein [Phenylobacterium sp.]